MIYIDRVRRAARFDRICRGVEIPFRRAIVKLKNKYIDDQMGYYSKYSKLNDSLTHQLTVDMDTAFIKYQSRIIRLIAEETVIQTPLPKHAPRFERKATKWEYYLRRWVTQQGGKMARITALTTFYDLNRLITQAFESGADETVVIRSGLLAKSFSNFRADVIARTETHNAATYAAESTVQDISATVGVQMRKAWQPVLDGRTRPDHAAMAGKPSIGMSEKFNVGGVQMDRPGDLGAPPEQVINCRCVCLYETVEE